jgi:hypothetical protein
MWQDPPTSAGHNDASAYPRGEYGDRQASGGGAYSYASRIAYGSGRQDRPNSRARSRGPDSSSRDWSANRPPKRRNVP